MVGQDMVRQSELRTLTTDINKYMTAVNTFKQTYRALPGDMRNAQTFWGVAHATAATCVTTVGTGTQTCNGDGNGLISETSAGSNEAFRFWQHLANADLLEEYFSGVAGSGGILHTVPGTNAPRSRIGAGGFGIKNFGRQAGHANWFDGQYGNVLFVGGTDGTNLPLNPLIPPRDMFLVDSKIDDGLPAYGIVRAFKPAYQGLCATTNVESTAVYDMTEIVSRCTIIFITKI